MTHLGDYDRLIFSLTSNDLNNNTHDAHDAHDHHHANDSHHSFSTNDNQQHQSHQATPLQQQIPHSLLSTQEQFDDDQQRQQQQQQQQQPPPYTSFSPTSHVIPHDLTLTLSQRRELQHYTTEVSSDLNPSLLTPFRHSDESTLVHHSFQGGGGMLPEQPSSITSPTLSQPLITTTQTHISSPIIIHQQQMQPLLTFPPQPTTERGLLSPPPPQQQPRHVTNTHYIHPLVALSTSSHNPPPYPNVSPIIPPSRLSTRASQQTLQSLDDDLTGFMYFSFKQIFEVFGLYNFDDNYMLEFIVGFKLLLFCHYDLFNTPSYLGSLQNMGNGRIIHSSLSQRLHLDIFPTLSRATLHHTTNLFSSFLGTLHTIPRSILTVLISTGKSLLKLTQPLITWMKKNNTNNTFVGQFLSPISKFFLKLFSPFGQTFLTRPITQFILALSTVLSPFARYLPKFTQQHPQQQTLQSALQHSSSSATITPIPYTISKPWNYTSSQSGSVPFHSGTQRGHTNTHSLPTITQGLTWTQRVWFLFGSVFIPYGWRLLERKIRQEEWQHAEFPDEQELEGEQNDEESGNNNNNNNTTTVPTSRPPLSPQTTSMNENNHPLGVGSNLYQTSILSTEISGGVHPNSHPKDHHHSSTILSTLTTTIHLTLDSILQLFYNFLTRIKSISNVIKTKFDTLLNILFKRTHYRRHNIAQFLQKVDLWFKIVTFCNTIGFIYSGKYLTPLHRVLNITSVMLNPSLPQPPPIFDTIYHQIANLFVTDVLTASSHIMLSLSNTNSSLFLTIPALLPIGFFFRNTLQQITATRDNLQSQFGRPESDPITLFDHITLIWNRALGRPEPTRGNGVSNNNNNINSHNNGSATITSREIIAMARSQSRATPNNNNNNKSLSHSSSPRLLHPKLSPCPLCRKQPTMPCQLTACGHVYCWYCTTQLHQAKQVCVECYTPIVGFFNYGHSTPRFETLDDIHNRQLKSNGLNVNNNNLRSPTKSPSFLHRHESTTGMNVDDEDDDNNCYQDENGNGLHDDQFGRSYLRGVKPKAQLIPKKKKKHPTWKPSGAK